MGFNNFIKQVILQLQIVEIIEMGDIIKCIPFWIQSQEESCVVLEVSDFDSSMFCDVLCHLSLTGCNERLVKVSWEASSLNLPHFLRPTMK